MLLSPVIGWGGAVAVVNTAATNLPSVSSTLVINLPSGIVAGNLLVICLGLNDNGRVGSNVPTGFAIMGASDGMGGGPGEMAAFYKVATGSEGATVSMSLVSSSSGGAVALQAAGAQLTPSRTFNASFDPPAHSPSWGAADTLWLAFLGTRFPFSVTSVTFPTGYTGVSSSAFHANVGWRIFNTATENPSTFTTVGDTPARGASTIGIRPA